MTDTKVYSLWAFGAFIFYKVSLDAAFYPDVSVIAALILAVITTISISVSSSFYAVKMAGVYLASAELGTPKSYFRSTFKVWLITTFANIIIGKVIVFGFSKRLNRDLGGDLLFQDGSYSDKAFLFAFLIALPSTLHFLSILFSVKARAKTIQAVIDEDVDSGGG